MPIYAAQMSNSSEQELRSEQKFCSIRTSSSISASSSTSSVNAAFSLSAHSSEVSSTTRTHNVSSPEELIRKDDDGDVHNGSPNVGTNDISDKERDVNGDPVNKLSHRSVDCFENNSTEIINKNYDFASRRNEKSDPTFLNSSDMQNSNRSKPRQNKTENEKSVSHFTRTDRTYISGSRNVTISFSSRDTTRETQRICCHIPVSGDTAPTTTSCSVRKHDEKCIFRSHDEMIYMSTKPPGCIVNNTAIGHMVGNMTTCLSPCHGIQNNAEDMVVRISNASLKIPEKSTQDKHELKNNLDTSRSASDISTIRKQSLSCERQHGHIGHNSPNAIQIAQNVGKGLSGECSCKERHTVRACPCVMQVHSNQLLIAEETRFMPLNNGDTETCSPSKTGQTKECDVSCSLVQRVITEGQPKQYINCLVQNDGLLTAHADGKSNVTNISSSDTPESHSSRTCYPSQQTCDSNDRKIISSSSKHRQLKQMQLEHQPETCMNTVCSCQYPIQPCNTEQGPSEYLQKIPPESTASCHLPDNTCLSNVYLVQLQDQIPVSHELNCDQNIVTGSNCCNCVLATRMNDYSLDHEISNSKENHPASSSAVLCENVGFNSKDISGLDSQTKDKSKENISERKSKDSSSNQKNSKCFSSSKPAKGNTVLENGISKEKRKDSLTNDDESQSVKRKKPHDTQKGPESVKWKIQKCLIKSYEPENTALTLCENPNNTQALQNHIKSGRMDLELTNINGEVMPRGTNKSQKQPAKKLFQKNCNRQVKFRPAETISMEKLCSLKERAPMKKEDLIRKLQNIRTDQNRSSHYSKTNKESTIRPSQGISPDRDSNNAAYSKPDSSETSLTKKVSSLSQKVINNNNQETSDSNALENLYQRHKLPEESRNFNDNGSLCSGKKSTEVESPEESVPQLDQNEDNETDDSTEEENRKATGEQSSLPNINMTHQLSDRKPRFLSPKSHIPVHLRSDAVYSGGVLSIIIHGDDRGNPPADDFNIKISVMHKRSNVSKMKLAKSRSRLQNTQKQDDDIIRKRASWPPFETRTSPVGRQLHHPRFHDTFN